MQTIIKTVNAAIEAYDQDKAEALQEEVDCQGEQSKVQDGEMLDY